MYKLNNSGPSVEPCGTPRVHAPVVLWETVCYLLDKSAVGQI